MRFIFFLLNTCLLITTGSALAFPKNCVTAHIIYKQQEVILHSQQAASTARLFLFQNIGKQSFWLDHPVQHPAASAGWASQIQAKHWSALVLPAGQENFAVSCTQIKPGSTQNLSCKELVAVCQMQNVGFPKGSNGSYWAAENLGLEKLWQRLQQRGFQIK